MYNLCLIIFIISATILLNTTQSACIYSFDLKKLVVYENLFFFIIYHQVLSIFSDSVHFIFSITTLTLQQTHFIEANTSNIHTVEDYYNKLDSIRMISNDNIFIKVSTAVMLNLESEPKKETV